MENDSDKDRSKDDETIASSQRDNKLAFIKGRPNIDEISRRNRDEASRERKSFYKQAGIITLSITIVIFLVYFFN